MRIATFIPAVLALTLFTATQAAPAGHPAVDAAIKALVQAETKVVLNSFVKITADICADVDASVKAVANVGNGLITADLDVEKIRISTKAEASIEAKAIIDAEVDAQVIAPITAIVGLVVDEVCTVVTVACIEENGPAIVAKVNADIRANIEKLFVGLKARIEAHLRLRLKVIINRVTVNLGLANVQISARVWVASNVNIYVKAVVKLWLELCAKINVAALIKAL